MIPVKPLANLPTWLGLDFGVQAAWRVPGALELSSHAADPAVF